MKKIAIIIFAIVFFSFNSSVYANNFSIATFQSKFSTIQGTNDFYFCESSSGQISEMVYDKEKNRWQSSDGSGPVMGVKYATPANGTDCEMMFVSPMRGTVRLKGTAYRNPAYIGGTGMGDGVKLSILKNNRTYWSENISSNAASVSYDLTMCVTTGDKIHFVINAGVNNGYDATEWWPTVEYVSTEYVKDEYDAGYFQMSGDQITELEFNEERGCYLAADGIAMISDDAVMPTENYSMIKRIKAAETGRYRAYAKIDYLSDKGTGVLLYVLKNGEIIWQQLCIPNEVSVLDVGLRVQKDDVIDVMVSINQYEGFNYCRWTCDISEYLGNFFKECSTSLGNNYRVNSEYSLSSFIKSEQSGNVSYSTVKYDVKHPMIYNSSKKQWESGIEGEVDAISASSVTPGKTSDACIDIKISKDGILKIDGKLGVNPASDGVLAKIYLNGEKIWSNRVGGEIALRFDDRFDEVYFSNDINVVRNVKKGDVLTFEFNKWRAFRSDTTDISGIKLKYIEGDVLSKTTKWKLENSTVIDSQNGKAYINGIPVDISMYIENGTTYILKSDIIKIFGATDLHDEVAYIQDDYVPIREVATKCNQNIHWIADRMVVLYDGISTRFGYAENSEIKTQIENGGDLFD